MRYVGSSRMRKVALCRGHLLRYSWHARKQHSAASLASALDPSAPYDRRQGRPGEFRRLPGGRQTAGSSDTAPGRGGSAATRPQGVASDLGRAGRRSQSTSNDRGPTWQKRARSMGGRPSGVRRLRRHDQKSLGRHVVLGCCGRLVLALDRALVHRQSERGPVCGAVGAIDSGRGRLLDAGGADPMSGPDVLLAVAGLAVTVLVGAGMILITPRGEVDVFGDATDSKVWS